MLVFPAIPENLAGLTEAELGTLRDELKSALGVARSPGYKLTTKEDYDAVDAAIEASKAVKAVLDAKAAEAAEQAATLARLDAELAEPEVEATAGPDEDPDEDPVEEEVEEEAPVEVEVTVPVGATAAPVQPRKGVGAKDTPTGGESLRSSGVVSFGGVQGKEAGEPFGNWTEFAASLNEMAGAHRKTDALVPVGAIRAHYEPERILSDVSAFNIPKFEALGNGGMDELTAALCAPCTPHYDLNCMNTTVRPVFNSLPQFQAPRGCVSIYPSPSLSDIDNAGGFWTHLDDANPAAVKNDCQTIDCATPTEYFFYGVYRCLTVKNMLDMTFPELVEAYLNRLAAASARAAEKQLLDLMGTHAYTITAPQTGFSASVSITTQVLHFLTAHRERERWDQEEGEMWGPRWLLNLIKIDIMRRRNTDGGVPSVPSDEQVNALFRGIGLNPHWFLDTPTWGTTFTPQPKANGALVDLPTQVRLLLAPRGKFALIDKGELRIGVTGNVVSRDLASLKRNEFTYFFETFEGIVNTNTCPADILRLPVCYNGVQTADDLATCAWNRETAS